MRSTALAPRCGPGTACGPTASGIAFTGRLAVVCLLLAGFLGVGSAIAQPHVLRMGDGSISVEIGGTQGNQEVHHYLIDTNGDGDYYVTRR